jgi:streptogramin lyase
VWLAYSSCCIVRFDPRTGESKAYEGHGGGHGVVVDQTDGTVWYSGDKGDIARRLDPVAGLVDNYRVEGDKGLGSNTQIFDSKGDLWLSLLVAGAIAKWDRQTDTMTYWDVPVVRSRPYGIIVDYQDKVWFADYHNGGVTRFDPETETFKHFLLMKDDSASAIRRLGVDSNHMIWAATWGSRGMQEGALYRLNSETGEVMEREMGIEYATPYNAEADPDDNIWVAPDNYLSKYDQEKDKFTHYPMPVRSDSLKTTISENGGIWFIYRNAGKYEGYGGAISVLYPDKDEIDTLAAHHWDGSAGYFSARYDGPSGPKVTGTDKNSPLGAKNNAEYAKFARAIGLLTEEGSLKYQNIE